MPCPPSAGPVHGRTGHLEAYLAAVTFIHRTLLAASCTEMLQAMADVVAEVLAGRTHRGLMPANNPRAIDLHDAVARAVRHDDPTAAEPAMRQIIDEAATASPAEFAGRSSAPRAAR